MYHPRDLRRQSLNHFWPDFTINLNFLKIQFYQPLSKPKSRNLVQKSILNLFTKIWSFLPKFSIWTLLLTKRLYQMIQIFARTNLRHFPIKIQNFNSIRYLLRPVEMAQNNIQKSTIFDLFFPLMACTCGLIFRAA